MLCLVNISVRLWFSVSLPSPSTTVTVADTTRAWHKHRRAARSLQSCCYKQCCMISSRHLLGELAPLCLVSAQSAPIVIYYNYVLLALHQQASANGMLMYSKECIDRRSARASKPPKSFSVGAQPWIPLRSSRRSLDSAVTRGRGVGGWHPPGVWHRNEKQWIS